MQLLDFKMNKKCSRLEPLCVGYNYSQAPPQNWLFERDVQSSKIQPIDQSQLVHHFTVERDNDFFNVFIL